MIYGASAPNPHIDAILNQNNLYVSSITRIETLGYHKILQSERLILEIIFRRTKNIELSDAIVDKAIDLRQRSRMGLADAIIAATAIQFSFELVTHNTKDFKHIPNLILNDPFATA